MNKQSKNLFAVKSGTCLNCETYMRSTDQFCPNCGQKRIDPHDKSVVHMIKESFLDYFHVDSTLHNSLFPLLLKPGLLSEEYLCGKRAKYVQPFKMFLVISLFYFLFSSIEMPRLIEPETKGHPPVKEVVGVPKEKQMNEINLTIKEQDYLQDSPDSIRKFSEKYGLDVYVLYRFPEAGPLARYFIKKVIRISISDKSFNEVLIHNASKMIFLLIPVAALLFRLLYRKSKQYYYDHLIFSLHFHTVVFLVFLLFHFLALLYKVPMLIQIVVLLVYLYIAMHRFYKQGYFISVVKLFAFLLMYTIIGLPLFFLMLTGISMATY